MSASAFLHWMYSMVEGLTAASTCRRTRCALFAALQTASMLSSSIFTGTASVLFFTREAIDLIRRLSTFEDSMLDLDGGDADTVEYLHDFKLFLEG